MTQDTFPALPSGVIGLRMFVWVESSEKWVQRGIYTADRTPTPEDFLATWNGLNTRFALVAEDGTALAISTARSE